MSCYNLTPPISLGSSAIRPSGVRSVVAGRAKSFCISATMRKPLEQRFWEKVNRTNNPSECWNWVASKLKHGYGKISVSRSVWKLSHRISWEIAFGEIPDGLFVCHKCDNPSCVNPNHLFVGTAKQNTQDMISKGRIATGERHGSRTCPRKPKNNQQLVKD